MTQASPVTQSPPFVTTLAFVAGSLNVWALMNGGAFATSQTGNLVASMFYLTTGHWQRALFVVGSVIGFGLGSTLSALILEEGQKRGRQLAGFTLILEAFIIATLAFLWVGKIIPETQRGAHLVCILIAFVAGAQGNAFHRLSGMSYGNVSITPELQGLFNSMALVLTSRGPNRAARWQWVKTFFSVLAGFAGGALLGALIAVHLGWSSHELPGHPVSATGWALLIPAAASLVLAVTTLVDGNRNTH